MAFGCILEASKAGSVSFQLGAFLTNVARGPLGKDLWGRNSRRWSFRKPDLKIPNLCLHDITKTKCTVRAVVVRRHSN